MAESVKWSRGHRDLMLQYIRAFNREEKKNIFMEHKKL